MDVDPAYKCIETFRGGVQWYMMGSKDFTSSICFELKIENNQKVFFSGQSKKYSDYLSKKFIPFKLQMHY